MHGDEINGTFILSRLADFLTGVDEGRFPGLTLKRRVLIIPAVNVQGINLRSRSWPFDRTDINRMFPGSFIGETTQRIAAAVLDATKQADYRVDIHSAGPEFEELPQVRLFDPSPEERQSACLFTLPAVMERSLGPVFTTTLMHAWKVWPGQNFLLRVGQAGTVQLGHCQQVFKGLVSFLGATGILAGVTLAEEDTRVCCFPRESAVRLYAPRAGMFVSDRQVGLRVCSGQELGYIYDSFHGTIIEKVTAPTSGLLTGIRRHPLLFEGDLLLRINRG
jgi:predicted deacylase